MPGESAEAKNAKLKKIEEQKQKLENEARIKVEADIKAKELEQEAEIARRRNEMTQKKLKEAKEMEIRR